MVSRFHSGASASLGSRSVSLLFGDYIQLIFILLFLDLLRTSFYVSDFHKIGSRKPTNLQFVGGIEP